MVWQPEKLSDNSPVVDQTNKPPTTKEGGSVPIDITNTKTEFEERAYDNVATTYDTPIATNATNLWHPPEMDHLPPKLIVPSLPPLPWIKTLPPLPSIKTEINLCSNIHNWVPPSMDINFLRGVVDVCAIDPG